MPRLIEFPSRAEWLASRSRDPWPIGASDAAKICCGKACEVWVEKKLGVQPDRKAEPWLDLGQCLEPGILEAARRKLGWEISDWPQTKVAIHDELEWARCTPDALRHACGWAETINAKNVSTNNPRYRDYRDGLIPHDHLFGAYWEAFVTDRSQAWIVALVGGAEIVPFKVELDRDVLNGMLKTCAEFRERYLIGDEEPEPDSSDYTRQALSRRACFEEGSEILLDGKAAEAAVRLTEIEAARKPFDEEEAQLKNVIRQAMGTAKVGLAPNGVEWYWTNGETKQLRKRGVKA